ncbi:MAG: DnaJ domain-containing protein [Bacteroidota bacterium]
MSNYYQILGVEMNASSSEIKSAYKKKAWQYHPDRNPQNQVAEETFKQVNQAYQILSDPFKRANYNLSLVQPQPTRFNHYTSYNHPRPPFTHPPQEPYHNTYDPANYVSNSLKKRIKIGAIIFTLFMVLFGLLFHRYMNQYGAKLYLEEARDFYERKKYKAALIKLRYAVASDPYQYEAYELRAEINSEELHNYFMAILDYNFIIKHVKDPKADIFFKKGLCYFKMYDFDESIIHLNSALSRDKTQGEYYYYLGLAQLKTGKTPGKPCDLFQKAFKLGINEAREYIRKECPQD